MPEEKRTQEKLIAKHWPVIVMIIVAAAVLVVNLVGFQVDSTKYAYVKRFGNPVRSADPGLNFKWPAPIETVWTVDNRIHVFEGNRGILEEVWTRDERNIIVTCYITWQLNESPESRKRFLESVETIAEAEDRLTVLLQSAKQSAFGKYNFGELVNIDPGKVKLTEVETDIHKAMLADALKEYGIDVRSVGIKHLGLPESVVEKVFERMRAERKAESEEILAEGDSEAEKIRATADKEYEKTLAEAEHQAKTLRSEGEKLAVSSYKEFQEAPELALFLTKLDSLRRILAEDKKNTIILDTKTAPFDLLNGDALDRLKNKRTDGN